MKTPPFLLIGCPIIIIVAGIVYAWTYPALHQTSFHAALIDAERPAAETDSETGQPTQRQLRIQHAFDELGLDDAQKQQIQQIRQTISDHQQRRQAILNVLTPEQREKWQKMRDARRNGSSLPATGTTAAFVPRGG